MEVRGGSLEASDRKWSHLNHDESFEVVSWITVDGYA